MTLEPRTVLLILHVAGCALGLGVAVFLDLHLLRVLRGQRRIAPGDLAALRTGTRLVTAGLALLWVSGAALTALAWDRNPAFLENPKLHAKLLIVLALTVNGAVLHRLVLPHVAARVGRGLFDGLGPRGRALTLGCGVVSMVSWQAAFLLGMLRELNFVVPAGTILAAYAAALALALLFALRLAPAAPRGPSAALAPALGAPAGWRPAGPTFGDPRR